jgi:diacylglycerol kinase (ATP)
MSRKIIYLINPISGTGGKSSLQELITRKTTAQRIDFSILPTNAEGNYDYLIPVIEKEKITDVVICGGDGTVSAVAAALMGTTTRIGIIPMGSGNGLAFAAKIPASPSRALDLIFSGKASPVDGFTINGRFSCMLCGIGFDAEVAHEFARQKKRGLQTYIRVSFARFFHASPYRFRISIPSAQSAPPAQTTALAQNLSATPDLPSYHNGEYAFPVDAFFISVANGNQFGNNFTIAPKARLDDGLLDIVVVKKMGKFRMVLSVIRQVLGGNRLRAVPDLSISGLSKPGTSLSARQRNTSILYFQSPRLIIGNPGEAPLHIDGDPRFTAKEFIIQIMPRAFMLIRPS